MGPLRFRFRKFGGEMKPLEPELWAKAIESWPDGIVYVELQDEKRAHTRQQEKFWWGVVVPFVLELWKQERGWTVTPSPEVVHDGFVRAVFGVLDTPLGAARRSSTTLTLEEYSQLIEAAHEHVLERFPEVSDRFPTTEVS